MDNYIYRSYGSGMMIFGHGRSSINLVIADNVMLYNGCLQTADDHGGIAFMFLNSSGVIANNTFATCPGTPLFYERVPGAAANWTFANNSIDGVDGVTVVNLQPPSLTASSNASGLYVSGSCPDAGAVFRFTTDGSRPGPASETWPAAGVLSLPPRTTAVNGKCFPSVNHQGGEGGLVQTASPSGGGIFAWIA